MEVLRFCFFLSILPETFIKFSRENWIRARYLDTELILGTLTRPVRSRTSGPIILNTNYTDKDRKPNEQPHGDPSAHKEPTRPSRTSSYLNSFLPNWRPQDNPPMANRTMHNRH